MTKTDYLKVGVFSLGIGLFGLGVPLLKTAFEGWDAGSLPGIGGALVITGLSLVAGVIWTSPSRPELRPDKQNTSQALPSD